MIVAAADDVDPSFCMAGGSAISVCSRFAGDAEVLLAPPTNF